MRMGGTNKPTRTSSQGQKVSEGLLTLTYRYHRGLLMLLGGVRAEEGWPGEGLVHQSGSVTDMGREYVIR